MVADTRHADVLYVDHNGAALQVAPALSVTDNDTASKGSIGDGSGLCTHSAPPRPSRHRRLCLSV